MSNKKYIVRTKNAGVFYGEIETRSHDEIEMRNVRKLWYWDGAAAIEQLAMNGTKAPNNCKFTVTVPSMIIADPIQIIEATEEACKSIEAVKVWQR